MRSESKARALLGLVIGTLFLGGCGGDEEEKKGGPAGVECLDASKYDGIFTLEDDAFCAVAVYTVRESFGPTSSTFAIPSWGTHGGPIAVIPGKAQGSVVIERFTVPKEATGELTKKSTTVDAKIPMGSFLGQKAVELPFLGATAIMYTGPLGDTRGELLLVAGDKVTKRFAVNGIFDASAVTASEDDGRLLYTGLSLFGDDKDMTNGLYAADACGASLLPNGGASCAKPQMVAKWGEASGLVAVDSAGSAFAVMSFFSTEPQQMRGFAKEQIAPGAKPVAGTKLFSLPGFPSSLGVIAPAAGGDGLLAFQPGSSQTFDVLDLLGQAYEASEEGVTAKGEPKPFLRLAEKNTPVLLMTDSSDRLWASTSDAFQTTFVVIARK